jgi:glycosyltransferase involved in cell wall biosynthesis
MRFHIPSIPHTVTSKEHSACAFTQNIVNFCAMMSRRGHEIIHYGHRNSKVECAELVTVIEPETYDTLYGNVYDIRKNQYTTLGDDSELYSLISGNTIYEISKRKQYGDFLLIFGGFWNKRIADAHKDMIVVEPAIGYPASFCNYKVYPSYACMHSFVKDANLQMNYYHVVIPHYFDVDDFDATRPKEDYFLFVGRLNFDKGITIAIDLAAKVGARLKVCGQGNLMSLGYDKIPEHVDFIGYVSVEQRKELMAKAKCLIMPTLYMEPFGCVAIEGMLSGTPILTNDWGGPGENNIHGVTGFKCRTFEQFEWAARNIHLINPKNCREWAEKNFSFDKIGHMYEEYLQSLQGIDWYKPNASRTNMDHLTKHYPTTVIRKIPYNLFQTFSDYDFIEIGTSDFDTEIQCAGLKRGISIEPVKRYLDALPNPPYVTKIHGAVSNRSGTIDVYSVSPEDIQKYNLPDWIRGCNTVNAPHMCVAGKVPDEIIIKDNVPVYTFNDIINMCHVRSCKYLKIDTEGHDVIILNSYLDCVSRRFPLIPKIMFEDNGGCKKEDVEAVLEKLKGYGYTYTRDEWNIYLDNVYHSLKSTIDRHVSKIREFVKASGELCEGNVFWSHYDPETREMSKFLNKRINLFNYSQKAQSIMEIGFNAGHSSLLFMLSNPTSTLQLFDLGVHSYTRPCFEYLSSQFPNRMKIEYGDSRQTVPTYISKNTGKVFDMIHIDGGHDEHVVRSDILNSLQLCDDKTVIISDDDELEHIARMNRQFFEVLSDALPSEYQYVGVIR